MSFKTNQWTYNETEDGVWLNGEYFDTKEQAIEAGKGEYKNDRDYFYVGQIIEAKIGASVNVDTIIENFSEEVYSEMGEVAEDYLTDVTKGHSKILEQRLEETFAKWLEEFKYEPKFFRLKNIEAIDVD